MTSQSRSSIDGNCSPENNFVPEIVEPLRSAQTSICAKFSNQTCWRKCNLIGTVPLWGKACHINRCNRQKSEKRCKNNAYAPKSRGQSTFDAGVLIDKPHLQPDTLCITNIITRNRIIKISTIVVKMKFMRMWPQSQWLNFFGTFPVDPVLNQVFRKYVTGSQKGMIGFQCVNRLL